ncbi:hypothetical protein PAGU2638_20810 [Lysobacter sp. PAGU 2638]
MVTLVILAIIVGIGVPKFRQLTTSNRMSAAANDVVAALQVARIEAVRQNGRTMLCPSTDGLTCSGTNWSHFIVFRLAPTVSTATPASVVPASANDVVRDVNLPAVNLNIGGSPNVVSSNRIWFAADGYARVGSTANRAGTIGICTTVITTTNTRDVIINTSGVAVQRNTRPACAQPGEPT